MLFRSAKKSFNLQIVIEHLLHVLKRGEPHHLASAYLPLLANFDHSVSEVRSSSIIGMERTLTQMQEVFGQFTAALAAGLSLSDLLAFLEMASSSTQVCSNLPWLASGPPSATILYRASLQSILQDLNKA